jgi:hypothetical protein
MSNNLIDNIQKLKHYMDIVSGEHIVEYAGISSINDFINYEHIIKFKYKIVSEKLQLSKLADFISYFRNELNYYWFIKIRPEIHLLESIQFNKLCDKSINARMRNYTGPKKIPYGGSVNGIGYLEYSGDMAYKYNINENDINMDDQIFIFSINVINMGAFSIIDRDMENTIYKECMNKEHEPFHTRIFNKRNIPINPIGINLYFTYNGISKAYSSHINMSLDSLKVYQYDKSLKCRLGKQNDGGYVIGLLNEPYDCYISAGINDDDSFSDDFILKYNMNEFNSFAFDGTIEKYPYKKNRSISFIRKNINSINDNENTNLSGLLEKYSSIFLKMDIEGGEYPWILSLSEADLNKFSQIVIELHFINRNILDIHPLDKIKAREMLASTHYPIHVHANNSVQGIQNIPDVIEVTYINKRFFTSEPPLNTDLFPLEGLDFPNALDLPDFNLNCYPFYHATQKSCIAVLTRGYTHIYDNKPIGTIIMTEDTEGYSMVYGVAPKTPGLPMTLEKKVLDKYSTLIKRNKAISDHLEDISTPVLIFHEGNISELDQLYIKYATPRLLFTFINVNGDYAFRKEKDMVELDPETTVLGSRQYRHMCSFWFVDFWHFVNEYDYVLRIDEDVCIQSSADDMLNMLKLTPFIYGAWTKDLELVSRNLSEFSHIEFEKLGIKSSNTDYINIVAPYTNLIGFNLKILRENTFLHKYIKAVDDSNEIYIKRWGDHILWGEVIYYLYHDLYMKMFSIIKYYHGSHNQQIN